MDTEQLFKPTGYKGFRIVTEEDTYTIQRYGNIAGWTPIKSGKQRQRIIDAAKRLLQGR